MVTNSTVKSGMSLIILVLGVHVPKKFWTYNVNMIEMTPENLPLSPCFSMR